MKTVNVTKGDHIFGIYPDKKTEFSAATDFLKDGLKKNELCMLISDYLPQATIIKELEKAWHIDVKQLVLGMNLIIKTAKENYFPDDEFDQNRIIDNWKELLNFQC